MAYSFSRLARTTKQLLDISDLLNKRGSDLVSLTEKVDTTSAMGEMIFTLLAAFSQFECKLTGERTKAALSHKKAIGEKYAPVPFGYKEVNGRLVEVEQEASIVAEILELREKGHTLAGIAEQLNTRGIEGKRGGKWYASTVSYLINRQAA